jgi:hypothetical protein
MIRTDRRSFILRVVSTASALGLAHVQARADIDESDPVAVALGYRQDTRKVDPAKYPGHDVSQQCGNCKQFQGKAGDRSGGCTLFGGKAVATAGWCSAWVKTA